MPLAFPSLSHGEIAFGFFNIDTDMLLLEHYFLYADQFCEHIVAMARAEALSAWRDSWEIYDIEPPEQVGDLMGAIHGIRHTGFIGAVYRKFPFPLRPEDFKQKPNGGDNREIVEALITDYATRKAISVVVNEPDQTVRIGDYLFAFSSFQELIKYVWRGGFPQWQNETRPAYVLAMQKALPDSRAPLFKAIDLEKPGRV